MSDAEFIDQLVEAVPTVVALPLRDITTESSPFAKLWALCDLVESTLRLLVTAGLAEHETVPATLISAIGDKLELPTTGRWLEIAKAVGKHVPKDTALPLLPPTVLSIQKLWETEGLKELRNRLAHSGFNRKHESQPVWDRWEPILHQWVANHLYWLAETAFLTVDHNGTRFLLRGEIGEEQDSAAWPVPATAGASSAWLCLGQKALFLGPLAEGDTDTEYPLVYMRGDRTRLQYLRAGPGAAGFQHSTPESAQRFRERFHLHGALKRHQGSITFEADIRRDAGRRVGREEELQKLLAAVRASDAGSLWLGGPAGGGKSCLMAAVMESLYDRPIPNTCFVPYRFRTGDGRCNRAEFLRRLAEAIRSSHAYAVPDAKSDPKDLAGKPVQEILELLKGLREGISVLLVLDGLDEIAGIDRTFVLDILRPLQKSGIRIVGAGRPEYGLPDIFAEFGAAQPYPAGLPPMSPQDIRGMLLAAIGGNPDLRNRLFRRDQARKDVVENEFVRAIAENSEGSPLYVNYVIGDIFDGIIGPENVRQLPLKLNGYHDKLIERLAVGDLQAVSTPLVVLLAESREPWSIAVIAALLCRRQVLAAPDTVLVERVLAHLSSMIRKRDGGEEGETYTLFHHSLRQHILERDDLLHQVTVTRTRLAEAGRAPWGDAAEMYLLRNGVAHLVESGQSEEALGLLTDFEFMMRRFQRLEKFSNAGESWYQDWDLVRKAQLLTGSADIWWNYARSVRHYFRRQGWEPWRVLFQTAMDHADDSPITVAAEKYLEKGLCDWNWVRWVNRPKEPVPSPLVAVLEGHSKGVCGALQLSDGRILSWAEGDSVLRVWDSETGATVALLEGPKYSGATGATELTTGRILSWSRWNKTLRIWDLEIGIPVAVLEGHRKEVKGAFQLTDGHILSWSADNTLRIWDSETGAAVAVLEEHRTEVNGAFQLTDGRILSWSDDNTLRIWDSETGAAVDVLEGHRPEVNGAFQLTDGRILSWSRWKKTLCIWDLETGIPVAVLEGHRKEVNGAFQLTDGRILSWSHDRTLRIWNSATGAEAVEFVGHVFSVGGAVQLNDGHILSWALDELRLWESWTKARKHYWSLKLEGHRGHVTGAIQLADGQILSWSDDKTLRLWNVSRAPARKVRDEPVKRVKGAFQLTDGRILSWSRNTLRIWDSATGADLALLKGHGGPVNGATELTEGKILSWSDEKTLRLWDSETGVPAGVLEGHRAQVNGAYQLTDGRILSWADDNTLRIWDSETGATEAVLVGHTDQVKGTIPITFDRILSWSLDNTLRIWNSVTGAAAAVLDGHSGSVRGGIQLTNGRIVSWADDKTLRLWDPETGSTVAVMEGHRYSGAAGALELTNSRILSWSGADRTLRVWDSETGVPIAVLKGHRSSGMNGVIQLADGRILSWSDDQTLRIWDSETGAAAAVLAGHSGSVLGGMQLTNGRILSWSRDNTLRVWDSVSATVIAVLELECHHIGVSRALQLIDTRILFWTENGTVGVWDLGTGTGEGRSGRTVLMRV